MPPLSGQVVHKMSGSHNAGVDDEGRRCTTVSVGCEYGIPDDEIFGFNLRRGGGEDAVPRGRSQCPVGGVDGNDGFPRHFSAVYSLNATPLDLPIRGHRPDAEGSVPEGCTESFTEFW